ncbi:Tellurium resistance [uncultured Jatrophihabitans sp.]|uniref:TerD family protein n=1 Tax=uncultured Jatrophihabitans sp. TaxID=1610747 RepID=UPI0035CA59E7
MGTIDYSKRPPTVLAAGGVSLSKVTLTKSSPSVSLSKQSGQLRVNLNWDAQPAEPQKGGFLKKLAGNPGIDLDLGCLFELADGRKGVVQALGNSFGSLDQAPYILLDGDDRSGANSAGETMFVNLAHAAEIARILVFACIYSGAPNFEAAKGVVTLTPASGPPIEVRLDEAAGGARMCAIALIEGGPNGLSVQREVRYVEGSQRALDEAYGWGMKWTAGRK